MRGAAILILVLAACSHGTSTSKPGPPQASWHGPDELAHVAADSPYVFALLEPLPAVIRDRMWAGVDARVLTALETSAGVPLDRRLALDPRSRAVLSVMDAMRGSDPHRWWENLGFAPNARWVLYGMSIWPVLRIEVANPNKLRDVARTAISALPNVTEHKLGDLAYWSTSYADYTMVAAVLDREAVVTLLPTAALEASLPLVLGTKLPERNLRDVDTVPTLLHRHGWLSVMFGFVDTRRLVDALDRRDGLGPSRVLATPACHADLDRLAAAVPAMGWGYTRLDATAFAATMVIEAPDLARDLAHLRTGLPAIPTDPVPLAAMTAAIDVDAAIDLARGWMKHIVDHPFTCGPLTALDDAARETAKALAKPMPPEAHGLRGLWVVLDDASKTPPSGSGVALVVGDQIAVAIGELMRKVPGLGLVKIAPDGRANPLPIAMLGIPALTSAHLAMRAGRAALAVGETSEARVTAVLAAPNAATTPLFRMSMDLARLVQRFPTMFAGKDITTLSMFSNIVMGFDAKGSSLELEISAAWAH